MSTERTELGIQLQYSSSVSVTDYIGKLLNFSNSLYVQYTFTAGITNRLDAHGEGKVLTGDNVQQM